MNLSNIKTKGDFRWRAIYSSGIKLYNCELIDKFNLSGYKLTSNIRLTPDSITKLITFETQLKKQLANDNCFLKSQLSNNIIKLDLISSSKQIKTEIRNLAGDTIIYSDLKEGQQIDIDITIDSIWSHNNYYPTFIYKIKPLFIQVCE